MKVVFVSNYYNHHQSTFCREMDRLTEHGFTFLETEPMDQERLRLGWQQKDKPSYVQNWMGDPDISQKLIEDADALLIGGSDDRFIQSRLDAGKLTFRVEETFFKNGWGQLFNPHTLNMLWKCHYRYRNKPVYMLCASANLPQELKKLHLYKGKTIRWGYFPEVKEYDVDSLLAGKISQPMEIVWCARFIDWKHPEEMIELANRCREHKIPVHITMLGEGAMYDRIRKQIEDESLSDMIVLTGAVQASLVRSYMEKASIFIATSGREEGWGAVLNEAMNSGCICFAKREMGAAGFLIRDNRNGYLYSQIEEVAETIGHLWNTGMNNSDWSEIRVQAYRTVAEVWNGEVAAKRLWMMIGEYLQNGEMTMPVEGPCSRAGVE